MDIWHNSFKVIHVSYIDTYIYILIRIEQAVWFVHVFRTRTEAKNRYLL